jgi:hypothetical protein
VQQHAQDDLIILQPGVTKMSQHTFNAVSNGVQVEVLTGWDRPLGGFFLVVMKVMVYDDDDELMSSNEDISEEDINDDFLFTNLNMPDDQSSHPTTYDDFSAQLSKMGILLPAGLHAALQADKENDAGNSHKHWPT